MKRKALLVVLSLGLMMVTGCSSGLADGYYAGSYTETVEDYKYVTNVVVEVKDNAIVEVKIKSDSNIATPNTIWTGSVWTLGTQAEALEAFEGIKVKDFWKVNPVEVDGIAGATLSSNRLYYAVIDALRAENATTDIEEPKLLENGTYAGTNTATFLHHDYVTNVRVVVVDDKITGVTFTADSEIATDPEVWTDSTWTATAEQTALDAYVGVDVKDLTKETPATIDGISGATLSSNRLYAAVIDALKAENKVG